MPRPKRHTVEEADKFWAEVNHRIRWLKAMKVMTYRNVRIRKNPLDLWVYEDIIWRLKPALIVEFGTWRGGSALWFAHQLERNGRGRVVTVDINKEPNLPEHERITYINGDSLSMDVIKKIEGHVSVAGGPVMIIEDSRHTKQHVFRELEFYWHLVTPGSFFIVEDVKAGVKAAVENFLKKHSAKFRLDKRKEGFRITSAESGFLRRLHGVAE